MTKIEETVETNGQELPMEAIRKADAESLYEFVDALPESGNRKDQLDLRRAILMRADVLAASDEVGANFHNDVEKEIEAVYKAHKKSQKEKPAEPKTLEFEPTVNLKSHYVTGMNGIAGVTRTPLFISGMATNVTTGTALVEISYHVQGRWKKKTIPYIDITAPNKIQKLANLGIQVTAQSAKNVVEYFDDLIACNSEQYGSELHTIVTDQLGWTELGFAGFDDKIKINDEAENIELLRSVRQNGNLRDWVAPLVDNLKNIYDCNGFEKASVMRIIVAISLASILIGPLGLSCFIGHVYGKSGTGKSLMLKVCASLFGDPRPGKLFRTINGTVNSLSAMCASLRNLPLIADELETVRTNKGYDKFIMTLTEGIERGRKHMNGRNMRQRTWANTIIVSGESNIINKHSMLGVHNRVVSLDIGATPNAISDFKSVAEAVEANFGLVGPLFVEYVKANLEEVRCICNEARLDIARTYSCTGKVAAIFAAILTADYVFCSTVLNNPELFPEGGIEPLEKEDLSYYIVSECEVEQWAKAKEVIADFILLNQRLFKCGDREIDSSRDGSYGKIDLATGTIKIPKSRLESILSAKGINYDDVKKDLANNGIIEKSAQDRYQYYSILGGVKGQFVTLHLPEIVPDTEAQVIDELNA